MKLFYNRLAEHSSHYCSVISKANGEDPIGTAGIADRWIMVEVEKPWSVSLWRDNPTLKGIFALLKTLEQQGLVVAPVRVLAIAPDSGAGDPTRPRVIYYQRPARLFAQFEKHEYHVAPSQIVPLLHALLVEPDQPATFAGDRQETSHLRELFICTHTEIDAACGQFGTPIYQTLRALASSPTAPVPPSSFRVWETCHFGGHKFAPTLIDFPHGQFWGHLEPNMLETLIYRSGAVETLRPYYRGWAGLGQFEQIAEREIWMQEGWAWLDYAKAGQGVTHGASGLSRLQSVLKRLPAQRVSQWLGRSPTATGVNVQVNVQIEFVSPTGDRTGVYDARVGVIGEVLSTPKSGRKMTMKAVPQYRVQYCQLRS